MQMDLDCSPFVSSASTLSLRNTELLLLTDAAMFCELYITAALMEHIDLGINLHLEVLHLRWSEEASGRTVTQRK